MWNFKVCIKRLVWNIPPSLSIVASALDWKRCIVLIAEVLAHPHIHNHTANSDWLVSCKGVFSVSHDFLQMSQYHFLIFNSSCFRFFVTWALQVSSLCQYVAQGIWPRLFGESDDLIGPGRQEVRLVVNVTCTDLLSLTCILHFSSQSLMILESAWDRCWVLAEWLYRCVVSVVGST